MREYRGLAVMLVAPAVLLVVLRSRPDIDVSNSSAYFHLFFVTAIAATAAAVALYAARAAQRTATAGPVLLAAGCLAIGLLMTGHGLVTPGVMGNTFTPWVVRLPWFAMTLFAVATYTASRPPSRLHRVVARRPTRFLLVVTAVVGAFVAFIVARPRALYPSNFGWEDDAKSALMVLSIGLLLPAAVTHWRRWRLGHDLVQFSLSGAAAMAIAAITAQKFGSLWRLSWWDYHAYLLAGFAGAVVAILLTERRSRAVLDSISTAFESDPLVHISTGYPEALRTLVQAVEEKDPYTHGHSRRTAELATRLGSRLRLSPDELRTLARGAYLHDIGKIGIPGTILNKPGRLDAAERIEIERHPLLGVEMVRSSPVLLDTVQVIRHHHEKWDGTGYPDGLAGLDIPFLARVTTVADVWDALTTDRPYRTGWSGPDALAHILAGAGSHFDPAVVEVLVQIAYTDLGVRRPSSRGDAGEAVRAAETCHELETTSV